MLWKKKKKKIQEERKTNEENYFIEEFIIPQIPNEPFTLGDAKDFYEKSRFVSPVFGYKVKDVTVVPKTKLDGDIGKRYDAFRDEKDKFYKKEDEIKKYGHPYREFKNSIITKEYIEKTLGTDYVKENKEEKVKVEVKKEEEMLYGIGLNRDEFLELNEKITSYNEFEDELNIETEEELLFKNIKEKEIKDDLEIEEVEEFNFKFEDDDLKNNEEDEDDFEEVEEEIKNNSKIGFIKTEEKKNHFTSNNNNSNNNNNNNENTRRPVIKNTYSRYELPPITLLEKGKDDFNNKEDWIDDHIEIINNTLNEFSIDGKVVNYTKGPAITRYEVKLEPGINVKKVVSVENNIKMALAAKYLNIQAPIPGKPNVGIEVSNKIKEIVKFGNICDTEEFKYNENPLYIGVGKDVEGHNLFINLAKAPHALVAGQTGSGKSVFINTILISLLLKNKPDDLKLLLIDPKKVELSTYNKLPHLLTPVIDEPKMASTALKWLVSEMDKRYEMFVEVGAKDIKTFNERIKTSNLGYTKIPYIVVIIDELADLMQTSGPDVEDSIKRITQKARASGIHMVVATQRPTTDVISGTIKSNIPTRIAFKVSSHIDSSTILDKTGAEDLLGEGDSYIRQNDELVRCQGAYISDREIQSVTDYIKEQAEPDYAFTHEKLKKREEKSGFEDVELLKSVAYYVVENETASINRIQKAFNVGFNKAQRIVEQLEELEIVGQSVGSKARDVLVDLNGLEIILSDLEGDLDE